MTLSIITINYNNLEGLKRTYDSVVSQTCHDYEWIIIDGGSTDGSKEFIEEHQDMFAYWCSEPDKGVYNAMNKGIAKAHGEYLQFLNSGDSLVDDKVIEEFIALCWKEELIAGDVMLDSDQNHIKVHPDEEDIDFDYLLRGSICHQALFIKRNLHEKYGMYDENLRIASDWRFTIECLMIHRCSYMHWHRIVVNYMLDGISESPKFRELHMLERRAVLNGYKRIVRPIEKRDKRIQELDLPVLVILKKKIISKIKNLLHK